MKKFCPICKILRSNHKGYKYPKLSELTEFLDLYPYDITCETMRLYKSATSFHDARYDTTALYLITKKALEKYYEINSELAPVR